MNDNRISRIEIVKIMLDDAKQRLNLILEEERIINGNIPNNLDTANLKQESNIDIQALESAIEHLAKSCTALATIKEVHDSKDQFDLSPNEIIADMITKSIAGE